MVWWSDMLVHKIPGMVFDFTAKLFRSTWSIKIVDSSVVLVGFVIIGKTLYLHKFSRNVAVGLWFSHFRRSILNSPRNLQIVRSLCTILKTLHIISFKKSTQALGILYSSQIPRSHSRLNILPSISMNRDSISMSKYSYKPCLCSSSHVSESTINECIVWDKDSILVSKWIWMKSISQPVPSEYSYKINTQVMKMFYWWRLEPRTGISTGTKMPALYSWPSDTRAIVKPGNSLLHVQSLILSVGIYASLSCVNMIWVMACCLISSKPTSEPMRTWMVFLGFFSFQSNLTFQSNKETPVMFRGMVH